MKVCLFIFSNDKLKWFQPKCFRYFYVTASDVERSSFLYFFALDVESISMHSCRYEQFGRERNDKIAKEVAPCTAKTLNDSQNNIPEPEKKNYAK